MTTKKKVMVIDDDPDITYLLGVVLRDAGYQTVGVVHARDALETALRERPDLVVMDLKLDSQPDGATLVRALEETGASVVIISARMNVADARAESGAVGELSKPFKPQELIDVVRTALGDNA